MISFKLQRVYIWMGAAIIGFLATIAIYVAPAGYSVFSFSEPIDQGVSLRGISIPVLSFLLINYCVVAAIGYVFMRPFFDGGTVKSLALKMVASFFVGYVCVVGLVRLISFICPYDWIYWPVFGLEILLILYFTKGISDTLSNMNTDSIFKGCLKGGLWILILGVFLGVVLLLQIYQGDFHWVGHGPDHYAKFLNEWDEKNLQHFPLISQHYDELIFHYFLAMPLDKNISPIVIWWMTLGLVKMSLFVFLWLVFRRMGLSSVYAIFSTLFIFLGTSSLSPSRYYLLFDSSNFLFFTVHSGRVAGIGIVLFWIVNCLREDAGRRQLSLLMTGLCALGLSALSVPNALWILAFLPWLLPIRGESRSFSRTFVHVFLAAIIFMYAWSFEEDAVSIKLFVALAALSVFIVLFSSRVFSHLQGFIKRYDNSPLVRKSIAVFASSLIIGLVFMGNIFQDNPLSRWTFHKLEYVIGHVDRETVFDQGKKEMLVIKDTREKGDYNKYCEGSLEFVIYYGWIIIFIVVIPYLYSRRKAEEDVIYQRFYEIFTIMVVILPVIFFLMDFTNLATPRAWLKSRFLEVPVYFIIFTFFCFLNRFGSKLERLFLTIILSLYIIMPFLATERPRQIFANGKMIINSKFWENQ